MNTISQLKLLFKKFLIYIFGSRIFFDLTVILFTLFRKKFIISVTYHDTPHSEIHKFRAQVDWFKSKFDNCSAFDLNLFLDQGIWSKEKPGLIITFDDGLASNYLFASQILDEYGFTGWFMIPAGIINLSINDHLRFAEKGKIDFSFLENEKRLFMSNEELLDLRKRGHQIVCHSLSHARLCKNLSGDQLNNEVRVAKENIEGVIAETVDYFAWVGGEEYAYSREAMRVINESGYRFVFATNCSPIYKKQNPKLLERYHVDVKYNLNETRFAISLIYSLLYRAKRARVRNLLFSKID
jgi:peptidoglycan/xylan/chitin deacetylase (PgdA/CDA1 family)